MNTLQTFCDFRKTPISFDFVTWLVHMKLRAQRDGCERLHVVLMPKRGGRGDVGREWNEYDDAETYFRFTHIVIPACLLAGATFEISENDDQEDVGGKFDHHARVLVESAHKGERIPQLTASAHARRVARDFLKIQGPRPVTITARKTPPHDRDSGPGWTPACDWLRSKGYTPVVVHDTRDALVHMGQVFAVDLDLRMALYQEAALNLHVNGGPVVLCWYSGAPFIQFNCALPADAFRAHWAKYSALEVGDQLPWATPAQRLVYGRDTFENIKAAVMAWEQQ